MNLGQPVPQFSSSTRSIIEHLKKYFTGQMLFLSSDSVKALKAAQSIDPNQWPGLILSSSTTELRMEGALFLLKWLYDACTKKSMQTKTNSRHSNNQQ